MGYDSLIVLATQRSGSTLFCRDLAGTGSLGIPEEYFIPVWQHYKTHTGESANNTPNPLSIEKSVTNREGVFSVKIMADQLQAVSDLSLVEGEERHSILEAPSAYLTDLLSRSLVIRVRRLDKISQAISRHVVRVRGYNHSYQKDHVQKKKIPVRYDFDKIRARLVNILEEEALLDEFCAGITKRQKIHDFVYEDFANDSSRSHVSKVLNMMDKEAEASKKRDIEKLADSDSEEMHRMFLSEWSKHVNHSM